MRKIIVLIGVILCSIEVKAPNHDSTLFSVVKLQHKVDVYLEEVRKETERINTILRVFRIMESGNNYFSKGKSGEYGAYQFTPSTWSSLCLRYFGRILDITTINNQDIVAYYRVKELVKKGYSDQEIASIWNSGSSKWENRIGINRYGVKYNVPYYVSKFTKTKSKIEKLNYYRV